MHSLNYHHLLYFWTVAREGGVARAARVLHLTQPAVSAQVRTLERALGERLFQKRGRGLALTETGRLVFEYADEIFSLGRELQETLAGRSGGRTVRFTVGVSDAMPKLLTHRLLAPALHLEPPVRLVLREGDPEELLARLATHALDLVLSDQPAPPGVPVRAFSHPLGESGLTVLGAPALAERHRRTFPRSLDGAPFLYPGARSALRHALERWFGEQGVRPVARAEIEDSAVLKVFGQAGEGLFAAPTVVEDAVRRQYGVRVVGRIAEVRERFWAITVERRIAHPAALAITRAAREALDE